MESCVNCYSLLIVVQYKGEQPLLSHCHVHSGRCAMDVVTVCASMQIVQAVMKALLARSCNHFDIRYYKNEDECLLRTPFMQYIYYANRHGHVTNEQQRSVRASVSESIRRVFQERIVLTTDSIWQQCFHYCLHISY